MLLAVIFDLDGTLVDSEQQGHRIAFNDAFEAFGIPDRWDTERYRELLSTTGGERRLFHWFEDPASSLAGRPEAERRALAGELHRWKTGRFVSLAADGVIPATEGAERLLDDVAGAGIALGIATTGSRQWVDPLVDRLFGLERFAAVVTGDEVAHRKPDPEAYLLALDRLGIGAEEAVAVEDSGPGWAAADRAGLACVVVANRETIMEDVEGADLIVDGFGSSVAVRDRYSVMAGRPLDHETLVTFLDAAGRGGREYRSDAQ